MCMFLKYMCRVRSLQFIDLFLSYAVCMLAASYQPIGILIFYTDIYKQFVQICFAKKIYISHPQSNIIDELSQKMYMSLLPIAIMLCLNKIGFGSCESGYISYFKGDERQNQYRFTCFANNIRTILKCFLQRNTNIQ